MKNLLVVVSVLLLLFSLSSCKDKSDSEVDNTSVNNHLSDVPPAIKNPLIVQGDNKITLSWHNPTHKDFKGVLIYMSQTLDFESDYVAFDSGISDYYVVTPLKNGTEYFFKIYTYDNNGLVSDATQLKASPKDSTHPRKVENFISTADDKSIHLSWKGSEDNDFAYVIIRRSTIAPPSIKEGIEVYKGRSTSFTDTLLTNGNTYYYSIFSIDDDELISSVTNTSAVPKDLISPANITNLVATPGNNTLVLDWSNPIDTDYAGTIITKSTSAFSVSPIEGEQIYNSIGAIYTDVNVINGTQYYYSFFTYDDVGNFSVSKNVNVTPTKGLPDTGQIDCWDENGYARACSGFGEDADYNTDYVLSFSDNGNGTIIDNNTGLIWQKCPSGFDGTECSNGTGLYPDWSEAKDFCSSLTLAGISNWRLPTTYEVISSFDYQRYGPTQDAVYFPHVANRLWASDEIDATMAVIYSVYEGNIFYGKKIRKFPYNNARCVSGATQQTNLTDNENGTVTDHTTGLIWQKCTKGQVNDTHCSGDARLGNVLSTALSYCENLNLINKNDWRLPNIKELASLVSFKSEGMKIDTAFFPNTHTAAYLSSTTDLNDTDHGKSILFSSGIVNSSRKGSFIATRCVRGQ